MEWSTTAESARSRTIRGETVEWPSSVAHALSHGGDVTACGRGVQNWTVMTGLVFPTVGVSTCPVCLRAVAVVRSEMAQSGGGPYIFASV